MKLYYSPGACSLAVHIALREAGTPFEIERVDLQSKLTESGADFTVINPKGCVPALVFDIDEMVTENLAILYWITTQCPSLGLEASLGSTRLLEALTYMSTEVHKSFKPFFSGGSAEEMVSARQVVVQRLSLLAEYWPRPYLFGTRPSVAFLFLPWLDRAPVRSIRYKGWLSRFFLSVFAVSFIALGYIGLRPAQGAYVRLARIFTCCHFAYFCLMPLYTRLESPQAVPERVR